MLNKKPIFCKRLVFCFFRNSCYYTLYSLKFTFSNINGIAINSLYRICVFINDALGIAAVSLQGAVANRSLKAESPAPPQFNWGGGTPK